MMSARVVVDSELQAVRGNTIIAQLAVHERNAIHRAAKMIAVSAGDPLLRPHTPPDTVFFPIDCVASVVRTIDEDTSIELALIGSEGLVGIEAFLDVPVHRDDVIVRTRGWVYRIAAIDLRNELRRGDALQRQVLRFAGTLCAQIAQTAICMRLHQPEQRLARWLLMMRDRTSSRSIPGAAAAMRSVLGLDQPRVAAAIKRLGATGCIRATEDSVAIVDGETLETSACECYEPLKSAVTA